MTSVRWEQRYLWNTLSASIGLIVRLVLGLLMFRLLWRYLPAGDLGFYLLLWSTIGFGMLLDLGFGFAVQRGVADALGRDRLDEVVPMVNAVWWFHVSVGMVLFMVSWGAIPLLQHVNWIDHGGVRMHCYQWFTAGIAVQMPLAGLGEAMRGFHRHAWLSWLAVIAATLIWLVTAVALPRGSNISVLMMVVVLGQCIPGIVALSYIHWRLGISVLAPWRFRWPVLRGMLRFSVITWLIACCQSLLASAEVMLVGWIRGADAVAPYQASNKIAEVLKQFSGNLHVAASSAGADLVSRKESERLRSLFIRTSRMSWLLCTPAMILGIAYRRELIMAIIGQPECPPQAALVAGMLLIAAWLTGVMGTAGRMLLVVSGREVLVLCTYLAQIFLLVIVSILLGNKFGMVGVAIAVLVSGALGAVPILMACMHDFRCSFMVWVRGITEGTTDVLVAMMVSTALVFFLYPPSVQPTLFEIFWRGLISILPFVMTWRRWRNLFSHDL